MANMSQRSETQGVGRHRVVLPLMWALLISALIFAAAMVGAISHNRALLIDEASELHAAYNQATGKHHYRDFVVDQPPAYSSLIAPLIAPENPIASVRRTRIFSLIVVFILIVLATLYAKRIGGSTAAGLTLMSLLLHSTFVERIIEIRPEGLAIVLVLLGLLAETSSLKQVRRFSLQALLIGTASILCPQFIAAAFGFAMLWLNGAIGHRQARLICIPLLLCLLPFGLQLAVVASGGGFAAFTEHAIVLPLTALFSGIEPPVPLSRYLLREAPRNLVFSVLAIVFLLNGMRLYLRGREDSHSLLHLSLATALIVGLVIMPRPFPPTHLLPILVGSLLIGRAISRFIEKRSAVFKLATVLIYAGALGITSVPRLLDSMPATIRLQLDTLRLIQEITAPTETIVDFAGLYFRPDAYPHFSMNESAMATYGRTGGSRIIDKLRQTKPIAFLRNYRTRWLPEADRQFLREHFVHYWGYLFLQGVRFKDLEKGDTLHFEVWHQREFEYSGPGKIRVDGQPFKRGVLAKGPHKLVAEKAVQNGRLIMVTSVQPPSFYAPLQPLFDHFD
jgi:hypothetical protein